MFMYDMGYLRDRNVYGVGGKEAINSMVVGFVRNLAYKEYPLKTGENPGTSWKDCVTATHRAISDHFSKQNKQKNKE